MNKKDISLLLGIGIAFSALIVAFIMEGGSPLSLVGPSAFIIIVGGLMGALIVSFGLKRVLGIPKTFAKALTAPPHNPTGLVEMFINFAEKARREGLLSLEEEINSEAAGKDADPLIKRGMSMVVDGIDASAIEKIFENEIAEYEERAKEPIIVMEQAGGFCPTIGIIGTVLGLISVLGNLNEPEKLGESIAVAFIATLYGVGFANLIFLPVANKLKAILKAEVATKALILDGIISIQAGDNPRIVREKLIAYIDEGARSKVKELEG
jgi:chemotaxis protein MotA